VLEPNTHVRRQSEGEGEGKKGTKKEKKQKKKKQRITPRDSERNPTAHGTQAVYL
jgi:hypothetical protein